MRPRLLLAMVVGVPLASWFACATGGDGPVEESAEGGGGQTGGGGGVGGAGGATTTTTTSSSTGTGGAGGVEPVCDEMPCKLVAPQCGCADDEQCEIKTPTAQNPSGRSCVGKGDLAIGAQCAGAGVCQPGSLCVNTGKSTCMEFCSDDAQCDAPGGLCVITLNDGSGGVIPDATLCSPNCDPITNVGCGVAGMSCQVGVEQTGQMRAFTLCTGSGAGVENAPCTDSGDCAVGFGCFGPAPEKCLRWCNYLQPSCPGAGFCGEVNPPLIIGNTEYGVCQ